MSKFLGIFRVDIAESDTSEMAVVTVSAYIKNIPTPDRDATVVSIVQKSFNYVLPLYELVDDKEEETLRSMVKTLATEAANIEWREEYAEKVEGEHE